MLSPKWVTINRTNNGIKTNNISNMATNNNMVKTNMATISSNSTNTSSSSSSISSLPSSLLNKLPSLLSPQMRLPHNLLLPLEVAVAFSLVLLLQPSLLLPLNLCPKE